MAAALDVAGLVCVAAGGAAGCFAPDWANAGATARLAIVAMTIMERMGCTSLRVSPPIAKENSRDGVAFLRHDAPQSRAWPCAAVNAKSSKNIVLQDAIDGVHAIAPPDLLAFRVSAAVVTDAHFIDP